MDKISRFFLFCSGAYQPILDDCPSEKNKFIGIGASIFFTGLFATFAAIFTLFTIFHSYYLPILIGLCWGLMIFNLDRYIVSSIKKYDSFNMNLISVIPRLILAIMLSIVIAKPLELKIFEQEIGDELNLIKKEYEAQITDSIKIGMMSELDKIAIKRSQLNKDLDEKLTKRDRLVMIAQKEADGTGGSGKRNLGPIYEVKRQNLIEFQKELDQFIIDNKHKSLLLGQEADSIRVQASNAIAEIQPPLAQGIAAQLHALNRLSDRSISIWWAVFFISLLFIIVESTPIILKSITPKGPYDILLLEREESYIKGHKKSP